jgi:outer membrane protein assembly factor BamB
MMKFRTACLARTSLVCLSIVAALSAGGCGGDGEVIAGPENTLPKLLVNNALASDMGYRLDWESRVVVADGYRLQEMEVVGDTLIAREGGTVLSVLDERSGRTQWTEVLGNPLQTFVGSVRVGNLLLVSSSTELLIYDIETGQLTGKQRLSTVVNTRPVIVGDLAIYGCPNGHVLAHNWRTGFRAWAYDVHGAIDTEPVLVGSDIVVVNEDGSVMVVTPDGQSIGRRQLFDRISNHPVATDELIYIAGEDQSVWALTRVDCVAAWRYRTASPLKGQPVLLDGVLYVDVPSEGFVALDAETGDVVWTCAEARGRLLTRRGDRLLVWWPNVIHEIDAATGRHVAVHKMPRLAFATTDNLVDGNLFLGTADGRITKLGPTR